MSTHVSDGTNQSQASPQADGSITALARSVDAWQKQVRTVMHESSTPIGVLPFFGLMAAWWEYSIDMTQRSLIFLDVLRQRGNQFFEHEAQGAPPVLVYDYEMLMDGRDLERPVNYFIVRIVPQPGQQPDPNLRPYVVIDPRAGHGPGIGGSKEDSQIGVALRNGHPVYFVGFRPTPEPGQTLEDIANAEAVFLAEVVRRHPEAPRPCVIGNCQAGWAVAMLAAIKPDLLGPIVLNGAPLSYWSGVDGQNPMRYLGSLFGGDWLTSFLADLGNGLFDGAYLVMNFESLNPANTYWSKQYNLYANVDKEAARFLNFEKWWHGFFLLNTEEMEFIVSNLFVGNKLEANQITFSDGRVVDLVDIKAPIVVFASSGDNITPPQQALNWLTDVYQTDEDILKDEQVIVYTVHQDIGHLGIFVSAKVARKQHSSIIGTMELIDTLPPGLYEMVIDKKDDAPADDPTPLTYSIRFVRRSVKDILAMDDTREDEEFFPALAAISQRNTQLYKIFVRPWVQAITTPQSAELLRNMLPIRAQHHIFSDRNPWMAPVAFWANLAREQRRPIAANNPYLRAEQVFSEAIVHWLDAYRSLRDDTYRILFNMVYGPLGLGAFYPTRSTTRSAVFRAHVEERASELAERLQGQIESGGFVEGFLRIFNLLCWADDDIEPRAFYLLNEAIAQNPRLAGLTQTEVYHKSSEQLAILYIAREQAIAALPKLLPNTSDRRAALELASHIVLFGNKPNRAEQAALDELEPVLGLGSLQLPTSAS